MDLTLEAMIDQLWRQGTKKTPGGSWVISSPADRSFLSGVIDYVHKDKTLSTNQCKVAVKIVRKHVDLVASFYPDQTSESILSFCSSPVFRHQPYESIYKPREARHIGKRKIAFSSKKSSQVVDRIKSLKDPHTLSTQNTVYFVYRHLIWVVEVTESNLSAIYTALQKLNFSGDEELVQFFEKCEENESKKSEINVTDEHIELEINNDEFLAGWFDQILEVDLDVRSSQASEDSSSR